MAIAYAARHPERVTHLIFAGAYAAGSLRRGGTEVEHLEADTLVNLIRVGWGREPSRIPPGVSVPVHSARHAGAAAMVG